MAKFKVGDRARLVAHSKHAFMPDPIGSELVIVQVGFCGRDYGTRNIFGKIAGTDEWQLEPIIDLGSWDELQKTIGWNPTKEVDRNVA